MIYLFNNDEELIKIINTPAIHSLEQEQSLTKEGYISDKLHAEIKLMDDVDLNEVEYMAIKSQNKDYAYDLFFVLRPEIEGNVTRLTGVQSGIEELRKTVVYDIRPTGGVRTHAEQLLKGTNWTIGYAPDVGETHIRYYYSSVFDALLKMIHQFNIEMQFHVEINGNKIGNRYIEFKNRLGTRTGKRVVYGHNALKIVKEVQKDNLVTALVGRGRGVQVSSAGDIREDGKEQLSDGYSRKIDFEEVEWRKSSGKPVDKPKGQRYVEIPEATAMYGIKTPNGARPKIGIVEFDTEDSERLLEMTYRELTHRARPQVLFKTTSAYLTGNVGDTVRVVRHDIRIDYEIRILKTKHDRLAERTTELLLGDILKDATTQQRESQMARVTDEMERQINRLVDNLPSASGFNRNYYTEYEPPNPRVNDLWFKPDPEHEGHYVLLIWNGEAWEELIRSQNWNLVNEKIREYENEAEKLAESFEESEKRAEEELKRIKDSLAELDESLQNFDFDSSSLDELRAKIDEASNRSLINAEMIGGDGVTRYNKNLLKGDTRYTVPFNDPVFSVVANGGGFKAGQTYTISFSALCELLEKSKVVFTFERPND